MRSTAGFLVLSCCVLAAAVGVAAQGPGPAPGGGGGQGRGGGGGQAPQNLKVLPKDWTRQQVGLLMQTFTVSLGLSTPDPATGAPGPGCAFCHAVDPAAPPAAPGGRGPALKYDLDDKPEKDIARKMIQMVMAINSTDLKGVGDKEDADVPEKVSCFTCHNGQKKPAMAPANGWGRGSFSLLPPGPPPPAGGGGFGPGGGGPGGGAPGGGRGGN